MKISYDDQIQLFEEEIAKNGVPPDIVLIKQTFLIWYLLVEGDNVINKNTLQSMLDRNVIAINKHYSRNPNLLFLKGWMLQISPWFILEGNDDGGHCLHLAYTYCRDNLLFRWALRGSKNLSEKEMNDIKRFIENKFSEYYIDYPPIKEYFQDLVKSS